MQNTIPTQDRIANKIEIDALLIPSPEEKSLMKATQASNQIHYGNKPHRSVISFARMRVKDMLEGGNDGESPWKTYGAWSDLEFGVAYANQQVRKMRK